MEVPFISLKEDNAEVLDDYLKKVREIVETSTFILGPEVNQFEDAFAKKLGLQYAIGVASGTDALLMSLDALGIGKGDEVIVPAYTFIATANVVVRLGATPVFVDILEDDYTISPKKIKTAITPKTKAVIPVHLYGKSARMDEILQIAKENNLFVVEDVAQATGAKFKGKYLGSLGSVGAFSFYPTKNLSCAGDGGLITTNDDDLAQKIYAFRDHGKPKFEKVGYNSRLPSIQAAILSLKLKSLDQKNEERIKNALLYNELFKGRSAIITPNAGEIGSHVFNVYTIRVPRRDELKQHLADNGIGSAIYYPEPLHTQPCFSFLGYAITDFPISEKVPEEVLSLPVSPGLKEEEIKYVAKTVMEFYEKK